MNLKLNISLLIMGLFLSACSATTLQAPCDQNAHFCGSKTKINIW